MSAGAPRLPDAEIPAPLKVPDAKAPDRAAAGAPTLKFSYAVPDGEAAWSLDNAIEVAAAKLETERMPASMRAPAALKLGAALQWAHANGLGENCADAALACVMQKGSTAAAKADVAFAHLWAASAAGRRELCQELSPEDLFILEVTVRDQVIPEMTRAVEARAPMWAAPSALTASLQEIFENIARRHVIAAPANTVANFAKEYGLASAENALEVLKSTGSVAQAKASVAVDEWWDSALRKDLCRELDDTEIAALDGRVQARGRHELTDAVRESKSGGWRPAMARDLVRKIATAARTQAVETWVRSTLDPASERDFLIAMTTLRDTGSVRAAKAEAAFNHFWQDSKEQQALQEHLSPTAMATFDRQMKPLALQAVRSAIESRDAVAVSSEALSQLFTGIANRQIAESKADMAKRPEGIEQWRAARSKDNYRMIDLPRQAAMQNLHLLWDNPSPDLSLLAKLYRQLLDDEDLVPARTARFQQLPADDKSAPKACLEPVARAGDPDARVAMPRYVGDVTVDPSRDENSGELDKALVWVMLPSRNMRDAKDSNYPNIAKCLFTSALEKGLPARQAGLYARAGCVVHMQLTRPGYALGLHQLGFSKGKVNDLITTALYNGGQAIAQAELPLEQRTPGAETSSQSAIIAVFESALSAR